MTISGFHSSTGFTLSTGLAIATVGLLIQSAEAQVPPASPPLTIFENVTLSPNFSPDPTVVRGISGGPRPASEASGRAETVTGPCSGFIDDQPDHVMVLTSFFNYLSLQVESPADTTLVVRGPGGSWCNDDYNGTNPGIAGQWLSGTYQIWIGSYQNNVYQPYVLRITDDRND